MTTRSMIGRLSTIGMLVAAAVGGIMALWPTSSGEHPRRVATTPSALPASAALPAPQRQRPAPPATAAPQPRRVPPALDLRGASPWRSPTELDRTSLSPDRRARLAELEATNPNMPGYLDYTLGLAGRFHECMPEAANEHGIVEVTFHFTLDAETGIATGTIMELHDSTISVAGDRRLLECADEAHRGHTLRLSKHGAGDRFYWGTRLRLPLEDNVTPWFGE